MTFSINDLQAKVRLQASIGPESFSISTEAERYDRFRILQGQPELTPTLSCTDMARFAIDMLRALKSPQEHH